jgi:hypothetical protein
VEEPNDPLAQLDAWGREVERKARRRHRLQAIGRALRRLRPGNRTAAVVVVLVIAGICAGLMSQWRTFLDRVDKPYAYPTADVPSGIGATSGTGIVQTGPFAGTPAESFPEGEAGLVLPTAQATGKWSEAEVAQALATVKKALIAAHLDHRMLVDHDPSTFLALLSPEHRKDIGNDIANGSYGTTAVRIAKDAKLAPELPRVSGRLTYREGMWDKIAVLEVISNYVWVYPFEVPSGAQRVVVVHDEVHWLFPKDKSVQAGWRGMNIGDSKGYWDLMDCAETGHGFTAPYKGNDASADPLATSTEPSSAYFQPDHTLDIESGCLH